VIGTATSVEANPTTTIVVSGVTETSAGEPTTVAASGSSGSGQLPMTGGSSGLLAVLGAALLGAGLALRRRVPHV